MMAFFSRCGFLFLSVLVCGEILTSNLDANYRGELLLQSLKNVDCSFNGLDYSGLTTSNDYVFTDKQANWNSWNLNICANTNVVCTGNGGPCMIMCVNY